MPRLRIFLRVDISIEDTAAIGADERGPADAGHRIDGVAGVHALDRSKPEPKIQEVISLT
jgi:hypothetical protein